MSELTLKLIQIGFLALLWLLVLFVVTTMRSDLFARRRAKAPKPVKAAKPAKPGKAPKVETATAAKPAKPAKARRGAPRHLCVTGGSHEGTMIELGATPITVGRAPENTVVLDDDYVSGRHARLYPHEGAWVVEDLGSTNGTYLGKSRLSAPMAIPPGTPVRIGKTLLELRK